MGKKALLFCVILALLLSSCAGKPSSDSATSSSQSTSAPAKDLGGALNLVLGSDAAPSVYPSYHIDVNLDTPKLGDDGKSLVNETTQIAADVAGKDVHILQIDPGQTAQKEGFIIGESEYKMVDGKPEEMLGQIGLSWAMWPLKVVLVYAYPVYFAHKTGSDTVNGRSADVYTFDTASASADASNAAMSAMGAGDLIQGKGTVWIDPTTGGMLKLDMTYSNDIKDFDQKSVGTGNGSIKIEVSKIDQVVVTSPIQ